MILLAYKFNNHSIISGKWGISVVGDFTDYINRPAMLYIIGGNKRGVLFVGVINFN